MGPVGDFLENGQFNDPSINYTFHDDFINSPNTKSEQKSRPKNWDHDLRCCVTLMLGTSSKKCSPSNGGVFHGGLGWYKINP